MIKARIGPWVALVLGAVLVGSGASSGGYVTGVGAQRTAHIFDSTNGVEAVVVVPESFDGFSGYTYSFRLEGSNQSAPAEYQVAVVVSPGREEEARWNGSGPGPSGPSSTTIQVAIGPDELKFTLANTPFAVELRSSNGTLLDSASFSVDLRYREPPADGGLLALAIASSFFWGGVLLYAAHLQSALRKLRSKAEALERWVHAESGEVREFDERR